MINVSSSSCNIVLLSNNFQDICPKFKTIVYIIFDKFNSNFNFWICIVYFILRQNKWCDSVLLKQAL